MFGIGNIKSTVLKTLTCSQAVSGLGFAPPMSGSNGNAFALEYVPLSDIKTDVKNFQNRADKYSEKSVNAIINAVKNGNFNWFAFDPVLLWQNSKGQLFVLSGHSRTEAFRRLAKEKPAIIIDNLTFDKIPAKIFKGDFASAKNLALNSNALSTPETLLERAEFYRNQRAKTNKADWKQLKEKALRENQGQVIWDLSFLPADGLAIDFLKRFKLQEDSPEAFENYVRGVNIAQWIGKAFQIYKGLSKIHDRELFNFLIANYGTKSGQYNSFTKLNERLNILYPRNVAADKKKVDSDGNFTTAFGLSVFEKSKDELSEIDELKKASEAAKRELNKKIRDLRGQTTDKAKIFEVVTPYFNEYVNNLFTWWNSLDREKVRESNKNQGALFGILERMVDDDFINDNDIICAGLGKPTIKLEFEDNAELLEFQRKIQNSGEASAVVWDEKEKMFLPDESLDGLTVNDRPAAVFNCPEAFLQTKGFTPSYTRLEDYSALIEPATGEKRLVGYGFEAATLDQLKNACKNYRQVAKLAAHLKGDTELQSAFNVWHWLHTNIKYNYDAPGQEEIRTPARTWADRESGVDCDCLAVFAACLLGAMGYKPRFEIVAFGNSPKFSHIYVNLNGAAVDRVLPVFLARPSGITKTKIMEIPVFELSGGGAMEAAATLNGIYESALAKVQAHEATAEDSADLRKSQVLMTLQNSDPQAYRLAAILMPHVVAIDDDGAWYFADAKVAEIADKADKKLYELKISEVNENIFNDFFNEILNEFKNITVKVERGSGTTVLTIAFTNPADDAVTITGDYVKKDFVALNPNFLTMRESLKNLLAVNYLGLASKYAVGLMTEQEAVAAGYSVETWKKAVKAFETLTRFWILIGGKAENIADIILNGSAKEPLTDKNINYEANIVATSDTDSILSGCKKRGLSGLNGLGETPTVASDIENLGEEGLEKILDWCSEIETEAEQAAENSNENPVNVLAENATPAAAASSAPAATGTKKNSLIWWLLDGAALGGGIAAATGGKKTKKRK